jgi:flagellar biosynthetic protein FliP
MAAGPLADLHYRALPLPSNLPLTIDMVVASLLMSLGMMMLPPSVVSLPFKLIFFVMVDGWRLVSGSLVQSFNGTGS